MGFNSVFKGLISTPTNAHT